MLNNPHILRRGDYILEFHTSVAIAEWIKSKLPFKDELVVEPYIFKDTDVVYRSNNTYERILHLYVLEEAWHGCQGKPFSKDVIYKSLQVYNLIKGIAEELRIDFEKVEPFFVPNSDTSVSFLWGGDKFPNPQLDLSIKLKDRGWGSDISYFLKDGDFEADEPIDFNRVKPLFLSILTAYDFY